MKPYCTQFFIEIEGQTYQFTGQIWAESYGQAVMFCNDAYDEYVVGEITKEIDA